MALAGLSTSALLAAQPPSPAQPLPFEKLAALCAPDIHPATLKAVVGIESAWNPYAIGVVGGKLERQPRSLAEAVASARELERQGVNFSMGLGQVNRHNLPRFGESYETIFQPCRNLKAGAAILKECFQRAQKKSDDEQGALRAALSCYYSGNFTRGFRADVAGQPSYVQKVVAHAGSDAKSIPIVPAIQPHASDGAVAERGAGPTAAPTKPAKSSPWVVFADGAVQVQGPSVQDDAALANKLPDKARTDAAAAGPSTPAHAPYTPVPPHVALARKQGVGPSGAPPETPFVQFID